MMRWPFCLRSTADQLRLRLVSQSERNRELSMALAEAQKELRKHRILLSGRYEIIDGLKEKMESR
jgi:hypothetical protein